MTIKGLIMKKLILFLAIFSINSNAADISLLPQYGSQYVYVTLTDGSIYPAQIVMTTDGSGTVVPISGGGGGGGNVTVSPNTNGSIVNITATTTAQTVTKPANAVGFIIQSDSSNTANIRWSVGSTASASVGSLYEPGRDSGYVPMSANISVISISGSQTVSIQWVLSS